LTAIVFDAIINDNNNQFQKKQAYACKKNSRQAYRRLPAAETRHLGALLSSRINV
jgi:hypothetical protein